MFVLFIVLFVIDSLGHASTFFPCACCDPAFHSCVHNTANRFSQILRRFSLTCQLDTSTYCCVPIDCQRMQTKKDNITLFRQFCQRFYTGHDSLDSMVNTIISSSDPISEQCHERRNSPTPALLPIPKFSSKIRILPPSSSKKQIEVIPTPMQSVIIDRGKKEM